MRVFVSGFFDPIHSGHLDYLAAASDLGGQLTVLVNSDEAAVRKKGRSFMPLRERSRIVSSLHWPDRVLPADDEDGTVIQSLRDHARPGDIFANGGDRVSGNTPEEQYCTERGIALVYNVGGAKTVSSSDFVGAACRAYVADAMGLRPEPSLMVWGTYTTLAVDPGGRWRLKYLDIAPGCAVTTHAHARRAEYWHILRGECRYMKESGTPGERLLETFSKYIPEGTYHSAYSEQGCRVLELQHGECADEDIIWKEDK